MQQWIDICPKGFKPTKRSRMCGKHFEKSMCFETPQKRYRNLNRNAIPSIAIENLVESEVVIESDVPLEDANILKESK